MKVTTVLPGKTGRIGDHLLHLRTARISAEPRAAKFLTGYISTALEVETFFTPGGKCKVLNANQNFTE